MVGADHTTEQCRPPYNWTILFQTGAASRCWRQYPTGSGNGNENCLTVDIFTPNVVYEGLLPVVVYVDGDDLSEADDETVRPSAGTSHEHCVVKYLCAIHSQPLFRFVFSSFQTILQQLTKQSSARNRDSNSLYLDHQSDDQTSHEGWNIFVQRVWIYNSQSLPTYKFLY